MRKWFCPRRGALALTEVPSTLLVIGGGVIGLELGSVYARLGTKVHVIELMDRILPEFDKELAQGMQEILERLGMTFHLSCKVLAGKKEGGGIDLEIDTPSGKQLLHGDKCLVSVGRRPLTDTLDIHKAALHCTEQGFLQINDRFQTNQPHIYAIGDVAGPPMLAHKGSEEGIAVAEILSGQMPDPISYICIPNVVYTMPEVASVGFSEEALKQDNVPYKRSLFPMLANSRFSALGGRNARFLQIINYTEPASLYPRVSHPSTPCR